MKDGGYVMVLVLVVIFGLIAIITVMGRIIVNEHGLATMDQQSERTFQLAEAGLNYGGIHVAEDEVWNADDKLINHETNSDKNVIEILETELEADEYISEDDYELTITKEKDGDDYIITSEVEHEGRHEIIKAVFAPSTGDGAFEYPLVGGSRKFVDEDDPEDSETDEGTLNLNKPDSGLSTDDILTIWPIDDQIVYETDEGPTPILEEDEGDVKMENEEKTDILPSVNINDAPSGEESLYDKLESGSPGGDKIDVYNTDSEWQIGEADDNKWSEDLNDIYYTDQNLTFNGDTTLKGNGILVLTEGLTISGDLFINPPAEEDGDNYLSIIVAGGIKIKGDLKGNGFLYAGGNKNENDIDIEHTVPEFYGNIMAEGNLTIDKDQGDESNIHRDTSYVDDLFDFGLLDESDFGMEEDSSNSDDIYQLQRWKQK